MSKKPLPFDSEITEPIQLELIGLEYYGDPFHSAKEWTYENEIGSMWNRYIELLTKKYPSFFKKITSEPGVSYEAHIESDEYEETKKYLVFIGLKPIQTDEIPLEFCIKKFPNTQYLRFTTKGNNSKNAEFVMSKWLGSEQSDYEQNYPYIIQRYDERYKGLDNPESILEWMIPIAEKSIIERESDTK